MPSHHKAQQKEKDSILEEVERAKRRDPLKRKRDTLLEQQKPGDSHRELLAALEKPVFDSERLKRRKIYSPESPVELAEELPNHKVGAKMISLPEHFVNICSRFWWIVS